MWEATDCPTEDADTKAENPYKFVMSVLLDEKALKFDCNDTLQNPFGQVRSENSVLSWP